ncbi:MAG: translation initiation factor IF-3, partial [Paludibacteraceae bacterium]|nr:translation initiation factor IF-3 [Paludibacteraceae bacterium]
YMYGLKKELKHRKKPSCELKEIQLSTNITEHDLDIKACHARKFINGGDKVKVVLTMRGREMSRREQSKKSLYEFMYKLSDVAVPESMPNDEGNKSVVILRRKKGKDAKNCE